MKISVLNLLRGGVFMMALVVAFAFTMPLDINQNRFGFYNGEWYNVTGLTSGYSCDADEDNCLYNSQDLDDPLIDPDFRGEFIPGPGLEPEGD